jgi:prephenate dehydrogenase/chorismate mutase
MSKLTLSILRLVAKRQTVARKIAEIKDSNNIAVEDLKVEKRLRAIVQDQVNALELDNALATQIIDALLDFSKIAQREQVYRRKIISFLARNRIETVTIIGAGKMGGWFARYFKELGRKVVIVDSRSDLAKRRAKEIGCDFKSEVTKTRSDLIVVAIPISETWREIARLQKMFDHLEGCKAIIEISSVKGKGFAQNIEGRIPVVSIHPLFGSSAQNFQNNSLVIIRKQKNYSGKNLVSNIFPQFKIVELTAKDHDKQMALMLSLPHALAIAFADVLFREAVPMKARDLRTPSFGSMEELASRVFSENSKIYFEIQTRNESALQVLRHLNRSVKMLIDLFERGNEKKFRKIFEERRNFLTRS